MSMLARMLKNLNNVTSCTLLNLQTLNSDHKINTINFKQNGEDPRPLMTC